MRALSMVALFLTMLLTSAPAFATKMVATAFVFVCVKNSFVTVESSHRADEMDITPHEHSEVEVSGDLFVFDAFDTTCSSLNRSLLDFCFAASPGEAALCKIGPRQGNCNRSYQARAWARHDPPVVAADHKVSNCERAECQRDRLCNEPCF